MIKKLRHILIMLFSATILLSTTSCVEDDWFYDGWWEDTSWEHDRRIEDAMIGRWYLTYVEEAYGECPYYEGDEFYFRSTGRFEVLGDNDFYESGRWYVENGRIYIDFKNQHDEDMVAKIEDLSRHFVALDIKDLDVDARYYLELEK